MVDATWGLVRAEPDGSLVIAGSAKPGEKVDVYADDKLLGEATAESSGDWVLVPDNPVATGGVELTLGIAGSDARAPQSFVVAIDPAHKAAPLVVASTPGQMSTVLQGLAAAKALPVPSTEASANPTAAPAAAASIAATPAPNASATLQVGSATTAAGTTEGAPASSASPAAGSPMAVASANPGATGKAPDATPAAAAANAPAAPPATKLATVEPTPSAQPETAPSIDAVEIDGDRDFFAGSGPNGATVRLYVGDKYIADAIVAGGRWLVEASKVLTQRSQLVRIDVLRPGSSDVEARAEVNFVIDLPQPAQPAPPVAVAANPLPAPPVVTAKVPTPANVAPLASAGAGAPAAPHPTTANVAPAAPIQAGAVAPNSPTTAAVAAKPAVTATASQPAPAASAPPPVATAATTANLPTPATAAVNQPAAAAMPISPLPRLARTDPRWRRPKCAGPRPRCLTLGGPATRASGRSFRRRSRRDLLQRRR